ncbi:MAG: efflux RND transporter permease subunit [Hydrotalea sp.]|nr:efflux RND transporter permease subunit [Hydrotalea sp.]
MSIVSQAQNKSRLVLATLAFLLGFGMFALWTIPKESTPDIQIPTMYVVVPFPGVSPSDAVALLVKPMEERLRGIDGIKNIKSSGFLGGANVQIEFNAGFDSKKALADVREAVNSAQAVFPSNNGQPIQPTIKEINLSLFPVISILLYGDADQRVKLQAAEKLQDALQSIPEVLSADIIGDRDKQVEILMSPNKMEQFNLRADQLLQSLAQSNLLIAAGTMSEGSGSYAVKVPGLMSNAQELYSLPVKTIGDRVVTLKDIADVRYNFVDSTSASFTNGQSSLTIQVVKRIGENMLDTIAKVKKVVEVAQKTSPDGLNLQIEVEGDKSVPIKDLLNDLTNNVVVAVLLVVAVVMGFLGLRSGILVGISVPGSFLGGILAIYLTGLTINVVVLFALILSVGMLVDDAIIVCEYAARRMQEGMSKKLAYREASTRMAFPIMTATLAKIVVFLPLLFWPGIVGQFMRYLPLTLIAVLGASLIFALLFLPVLGTELDKVKRIFVYVGLLFILAVVGGLLLKVVGVLLALVIGAVGLSYYTRRESYRAKIAAEEKVELEKEKLQLGEMKEEMPEDKPHQLYVSALRAVIKRPVTSIVTSVALLMLVFVLYGKFNKGMDFFPNTEPEQFSLTVSARGNLSVQDKIGLVKEVEAKVLDYKNKYGGIQVVNSLIGQRQQEGDDIDKIGEVVVEMKNWRTRPRAQFIIDRLLQATNTIPGILVRTKQEQTGPKAAKPIDLELYSDDPEILRNATIKVAQEMQSNPNLIEVSNDLPPPSINWEVQVDRQAAAQYGANVQLIGTFVQLVTQGVRIGSITTNDSKKQVAVIVRYPEAYRGLSGLDRIKANTQKGPVPLSYFVKRQATLDEGTVNRTDQKNTHVVVANVKPGVVPGNEIKNTDAWLKKNLPAGVTYRFTGDQENQRESQVFLLSAFSVAIFMIAGIMLLEFNSFSTCLFILTAVIMSTAGVLIGLMIMQQAFSVVMTGLGIISLAGIIVNNNIVLIDTYDHHRHAGVAPLEAIILAGAQRLRPVFLTSLCTVLGLLPVVFAINIDFVHRAIDIGGPSSQLWVGLATAIAFGMIFATPFTLLITPCMLIARERYFGHIPGIAQNQHRISDFLMRMTQRFGGR